MVNYITEIIMKSFSDKLFKVIYELHTKQNVKWNIRTHFQQELLQTSAHYLHTKCVEVLKSIV